MPTTGPKGIIISERVHMTIPAILAHGRKPNQANADDDGWQRRDDEEGDERDESQADGLKHRIAVRVGASCCTSEYQDKHERRTQAYRAQSNLQRTEDLYVRAHPNLRGRRIDWVSARWVAVSPAVLTTAATA